MSFRATFASDLNDVVAKLNLNLRDLERSMGLPAPTQKRGGGGSVQLPIPSPKVSKHNDSQGLDGGDSVAKYYGHVTESQNAILDDAGQATGVIVSDANNCIPISQIPASLLGSVRYQGVWDASANAPALATSPGATTKGFYYVVSVAGTWNSMAFSVGDWVISNGSAWQRVDNVDAVTSVFGRSGAIVATAGDYTAAMITNTPAGSISATTVQAAINELDTEKAAINATLADNAASTTLPTAGVATTITTLLQQTRNFIRGLRDKINARTPKLVLGTCTTAQATVAKDVTIADYVLTQGDIIEVLFTNASVASATLNVNGTGAKAIYDNGAVANASSWSANQIVGLLYDGAYWHVLWTKSVSGSGVILDKTRALYVNVHENSTSNTNYPICWNDGSQGVYKTAAKLYFNPSAGQLTATKLAVIGGDSTGFLKADGSVDSTDYQEQLTIDSVPTSGSNNPVTSNGVYDAIASVQKPYTYAASNGATPGWLSGISMNIPKSVQYRNSQTIFCVRCWGDTSAASQWTARVMLSIKIQDYVPSYKLVVLDGDNYLGKIYGRYDQDANYHYFTPEFYIIPYGTTCVNLEGGDIPTSFTGEYVASVPSHAVVATLFTEWVKDVCPQLGSGFAAGTYHWYGPLASRGWDYNAVYFCY